LLPGIERRATATEEDGDQHFCPQDASCNDLSVHSISPESASSLLLFPSLEETRSPEGTRSNREMASLPCMANGNLKGVPAAIWTSDVSVGEAHEKVQTGSKITTTNNNEVLTGSNIIKEKKFHNANALPASAANRKASEDKKKDKVFASQSSSSTTKIKCSKNEDNNSHFRLQDTRRNEKKALPRKRQDEHVTYRQYNSMIQQIPEIADRCKESALKCKKALKTVNKLLRTSRIENFWLRWNLQEMGLRISQSEYNATVMPTSVGTPLGKATNAGARIHAQVRKCKVNNTVNRDCAFTELASSTRACARPNFLSGQRKL